MNQQEPKSPDIDEELTSLKQTENGTSPLDTVKSFMGITFGLGMMGAAVEVVGGMGGGIDMPQQEATQMSPTIDNNFDFGTMSPPNMTV